ncbi:MAG: hypothetical protein WC294_10600 [Methanoregula sp.]|jgi:hypothetical protein
MKKNLDEKLRALEERYSREIEKDHIEEMPAFKRWHDREGLSGWECFSVPEINFYQPLLNCIGHDDVVFDVGAGDLRLDLMISEKAKRVYAVEVNPTILSGALDVIGFDMPCNLIAIRGNAFDLEPPGDTTVITCLMIHRAHAFPETWTYKKIIYAAHEGLYCYENCKTVQIHLGEP